MLLKNRNVEIQIVDTTTDLIVEKYEFFVKSIDYDLKPKSVEFYGLKYAETLQWYSSLINFTLSGDSYVNPFILPTLIKDEYKFDSNIKKLYDLYMNYFKEGENFEVGQYKVRLKINNCPIGHKIFEGVISSFNFKESDETIGLLEFTITIIAKPITVKITNDAIKGFINDLFLKR